MPHTITFPIPSQSKEPVPVALGYLSLIDPFQISCPTHTCKCFENSPHCQYSPYWTFYHKRVRERASKGTPTK